MPTLNKLEYLDETKQQIKSALNTKFNTGITDEDTFRSYVSKIVSIYNSWPKVTGAGTEVTLNNCKKGKMMAYLKGNTSQETTTGKNILKPVISTIATKGTTTTYNSETGYYTTTGTTSSSYPWMVNYYVNIPTGTKLVISSNSQYGIYARCYYDADNYEQINTNNKPTMTLTHDAIRIAILSNAASGVQVNETYYVQVEIGDTATSFEKYTNGASPNPDYPQDVLVATGTQKIRVNDTTNYLVPLGNIELCKIGNYYDYFYKSNGNWYKKKYISKVVLDGSENWSYASGSSSPYRYFVSNLMSDRKSGSNVLLSNYFQQVTNLTSVGMYNGQNVNFGINDIDTISAFQTWLSTHNTTVYYVLATAVDEQITSSLLIDKLENLLSLMSVDGTNTVNVLDNDEPERAIINVTALKGGA